MGRTKKNVEVEAQVIARGNVVPMMTETESAETVQYVSDEDAAREDRLVSEIRMITEQTKQVVLFNSIEIGRRLTEAKAMVKHGTWGTWLKERVDYSQRTANNFMKIYALGYAEVAYWAYSLLRSVTMTCSKIPLYAMSFLPGAVTQKRFATVMPVPCQIMVRTMFVLPARRERTLFSSRLLKAVALANRAIRMSSIK